MKYISIILFVLIFFNSCKKDPLDIPIGTLKADFNGASKTFNVNAKAKRLSVSGGYGIQIQGYFKSGSTTNFSFSIVSPSPLSAGSYIENSTGNPLIEMINCTEVLFPCFARTANFGSSSNPVSITITEISGSSVKGSFKGELQGTSANEVVSNGVFYLSF
jgi:hypothetical protein